MSGVSKRVYMNHLVRKSDKMSMPTLAEEGNPTIQSDRAETSAYMDICTNAHRYNARSKDNCKTIVNMLIFQVYNIL